MDDNKTDDSTRSDWKQASQAVLDPKSLSKKLRKAEIKTTRHAHRFILKRLESLRASQQHIIAWLLIVTAVVGTIGAQMAISSQRNTVEAATQGGTYVEGVVGKLETLNPLYASSSAEVAASRLMFSSLYDYDATGHLRPSVAKNMSISEDGRTYTVTIRDDIKWHDGAKLTAEDVAFTIAIIKNPEARVRSSLAANWQSVDAKAASPSTLIFRLPAYAAFPHALTFPIVPKHILSRIPASTIQENAFSLAPVGSGPFKFRLFQDADSTSRHKVVHMTANADYFTGVPLLTRFELHAYQDNTALVKAVKAREVTAAADIAIDQPSLTKSGYKLEEFPIDSGVYALINTDRESLKDQKIRAIIRQAIDLNKVRQAAGENLPALDLPYIASQVTGAEALSAPASNAAEAAKQLQQDGWKLQAGVWTKDKQKLIIAITTTNNPQYERATKEIAHQLSVFGIKTTTNIVDTTLPRSNFIQDVLQARNYDMLVYELPIGADPDVYAYWHSSQLGAAGYNFTNYRNGIADAALVSARDRSDQRLRDAKYLVFAKQWLLDVPAIGLYQQTMNYASSTYSTNIDPHTNLVAATERYSNVLRWAVDLDRVYKTP